MIERAFIGGGNMAEAIVRGLLGAGAVPGTIAVADPNESKRATFAALGCAAFEHAADAARDAPVVVLATKPKHAAEALASVRLADGALLVSIAAGLSTAFLERAAGDGTPVVRTMPNTPVQVGVGAVALAAGRHARREHVVAARKLFEASAVCVEVDESLMDAVTALSGSGPAYVFWLCEQMAAAGIELGLPADVAALLARQTVAGAGAMLAADATPADELRRRVTSPGGTTQAALEVLGAHAVGDDVRAALRAARDRGRELSGAR